MLQPKLAFDWNQARAFLAVSEHASFSAAARALGVTQPTVSRQIAALEAALGVTLFERGPRTMALTQTGAALAEHVRAMGEHAAALALSATGAAAGIEGRVAITATSLFASRHLPALIAALRTEAPGIEVEIVASNALEDLRRRDADIAIRHARPDQQDLIARLVGEIGARIYAAPGYLDRAGRPATLDALAAHDYVGFEQPERMVATLAEYGLHIDPKRVPARSTSGEVLVALVQAGLGLSVLPDDAAQAAGLEPVLGDTFSIPVPVWLVTHRELHTSARIRLVFDRLASHLKAVLRAHENGRPEGPPASVIAK
ncbi:MAG: LysR family transcriptional regulator [Oceanicaulis sp.]